MEIKVKYEDVKFIWISHHYDVHWAGICRYNSKLYNFNTSDETDYDTMSDNCPYCSQENPSDEEWVNCNCSTFIDLYCFLTPLTFIERLKWKLKTLV